MTINKVGQSANNLAVNTKLQKYVQKPAVAATNLANTNVKKDTLNLSEKAKDLMAKQNETVFQEEQKESQTAKMKELQ